MELEEMKQLWEQYNKQLEQKTEIAGNTIRTMLQHRNSDWMNRIMNMEYLSAAMNGIVIVLLGGNYSRLPVNTEMNICFSASMLLMLVVLAWNIYKIRYLSALDFTGTVTAAAERVNRFRLMITREKMALILLAPALMAVLMPVLHQMIYNSSILLYPKAYLLRMIAGYPVCIVLCYWLYKKTYFRNLQLITANLKEIEQFKQ